MYRQTLLITVADDTTTDNFTAQAAEGKISFHKERANGSTRRVHYLTGEAYAEALWIADQREAGQTMRQLSDYLHISVPAIRRILNDLTMTDSLNEADADELAEILAGAAEAPELDADLPQTTEDFVAAVAKILG